MTKELCGCILMCQFSPCVDPAKRKRRMQENREKSRHRRRMNAIKIKKERSERRRQQ
jgi:hypothetical protein